MRKKELGETSKKRRTDFRFLCATQPSHGESINSAATVAHTYTHTGTHMRAFYKPSIPTGRVICLSFALSVHPCLLICILSPPAAFSARGVACVRVELLGSCFVG